jgi:hypothetical protein
MSMRDEHLMVTDYQFVLELFRDDGSPLDRVPLSPDWEPAVEWARLAQLRATGVWLTDAEGGPSIQPIWHENGGQPIAKGFRVELGEHGPDGSRVEFGATRYFGELARSAVAQLIKAGRVAAADRVLYQTTAFVKASTESPRPFRFDFADRPAPLAVHDTEVATLIAAAVVCGGVCADDFGVLIPQRTLTEATALTEMAEGCETGGVLIGNLHRDPVRTDLLVEVTAQIPARHTVGDARKLTFTSETWTDVRNAIALRRKDEAMLGFWHSHPAKEWCKQCPPERQRECHLAKGFFSADDLTLHRTIFPRAFSIALVVTNALGGIDHTLFGWRQGVMVARGFYVSGSDSGTGPV